MRDTGHRTCVETALNHEVSDRTPVNNFALVTAARSAGMTVDAARWHPEVSARVAIDYAMKTFSDFVKPVVDSQIPFADLGLNVLFPEDDYGYVKKAVISKQEDVDGLAFFDPQVAKECPGFTNVIVNSLEETNRMLDEDLHICGLSWGPITTAGYLMGAEELLMGTFMDPDTVKSLIKKVTPFISDMQIKMMDAGATVMWMADPTASEDMISPDMFREYCFDPIKSVIGTVKRKYDAPAFLHICGNTIDLIPMLPETGTDCFSLDHAVDLRAAKEQAGGKISLMGNIDPVGFIMSGTPERITDECYRMIDVAGQDGGYIIAPGCETPLSSPDENVIAMGKSGRGYWKR